MSADAIAQLLGRLNQGCNLRDAIRLSDIKTEEDLAAARSKGYAVSFTAGKWSARFPRIPADKVLCFKSAQVGLLYYDRERHIPAIIPMYGDDLFTMGNLSDSEYEDEFLDELQEKERLCKERKWTPVLNTIYSEASGNLVMPLVLDILHDEAPSGDLYDLFISYYTLCDSGSAAVSPEDLAMVERCKSDAQRAETAEKLEAFPDEITVYRGEGSLSTPHEKAISWTTEQSVAFKFAAWRSNEGVKVYKGTIRKSDVLDYLEDRHEAEVLVRPGTVLIEQCIDCVDWDAFIATVGNRLYRSRIANDEVQYSGMAMLEAIDENYYLMNVPDIPDHEIDHVKRVTLMSNYLYKSEVAEKGKGMKREYEVLRSLVHASQWHDAGRVNNIVDPSHGAESARIFRNTAESRDAVAEFLMEYHCRSDEEAHAQLSQFKDKDQPWVWLAYQCLKDADALDRWRFGPQSCDFVDVSMLRLERSKTLMSVAAYLQKVQL